MSAGWTSPVDPAVLRRMRGQGTEGTGPELAVRRALTSLGLRYRINVSDLPGSPDVANKTGRWAVFVHGCFWHHHDGCRRATSPGGPNAARWQEKFRRNRARDRRAARELRRMGYRVLTVWECRTGDAERLVNRLRRELAAGR